MSFARTVVITASVAGTAAALVHASPSLESERGRAFVAEWCAPCHETETGVPPAPDLTIAPPDFRSIARDQAADDAAFRETLTKTHLLMPIPRLDGQTREDVLAYFLSLTDTP